MKLIASNPLGQITVLNLDLLGAYRLMLAGADEYLGVGIKYPSGASFATLIVAAITIPGVPEGGFKAIENHGLGLGDAAKDTERLKDAMKTLYNSVAKASIVDDAIEKAKDIVDFYWWMKPWIMGSSNTQSSDERVLGAWSVTVRK